MSNFGLRLPVMSETQKLRLLQQKTNLPPVQTQNIESGKQKDQIEKQKAFLCHCFLLWSFSFWQKW
jgi:hypothetical protein